MEDRSEEPKEVVSAEDVSPTSPAEPVEGKPPFSRKRFILVVIIVLAALGIGFLGYTLLFATKDKASPNQSNSSSQDGDGGSDFSNSLTETFSSATLRLELRYPTDWTVEEMDRGVRIESPAFGYETLEKGQVDGKFKVYIRKGARSVDSKYLGRGYAIAPSEKINYSEPATGQREDTYLTAFGLDTPDNFGYFLVQGSYDLKKGETLGPKFAKEIDSYLIFGGYGADDIDDDMGSNEIDAASYVQSDEYKLAVEIIKSLKLN